MGHNVVIEVVKSLYQTVVTITATFHTTPVTLGEIVGCIFALAILFQAFSALRGRTSFTLEDTTWDSSSASSPPGTSATSSSVESSSDSSTVGSTL